MPDHETARRMLLLLLIQVGEEVSGEGDFIDLTPFANAIINMP